MIIVLGTMSFVFPQSSEAIYNDWKKERRKVERKNDDPKNIQLELDKIDSTYISFYRLALENERSSTAQPSSSPATSTKNKRTVGANINLPLFQGGSYNIKDAAVAYATVVTTDANAYYTKTIAENYSKSQNGGAGDVSFKCLLRNEDYRNVVFTIKGVGGVLIITPTVPARGELEIDLPPGIYTITTNILAVNKTESKAVTREVGNPAKYSFWAGKKYWFVLTQPMDN